MTNVLRYDNKEVEIEPNSSKEHIFIHFTDKESLNDFWNDFEENGVQSYEIQKGNVITEASGIGLIGIVIKYKYLDEVSYTARFDVAQGS